MIKNRLTIIIMYSLMTQMIERRIMNRAIKIRRKLREALEKGALFPQYGKQLLHDVLGKFSFNKLTAIAHQCTIKVIVQQFHRLVIPSTNLHDVCIGFLSQHSVSDARFLAFSCQDVCKDTHFYAKTYKFTTISHFFIPLCNL